MDLENTFQTILKPMLRSLEEAFWVYVNGDIHEKPKLKR